MTAGRPKLPKTDSIAASVSEAAVKNATEALDIVGAHQRDTAIAVFEIARRMEYQGSLNPDDLEAGLKADKEEMGNVLFRAGTRFLLLKEQCPHGEFIERIRRAGYQPREAQRAMQAVLAFSSSNASTSTHLNTQKIQALSKSKVVELYALEDKEIVELKETGSVRSITLDEMDCMSVSELRSKLKQAEEAVKAVKAEAAATMQAKDQLLTTVRERANKAEEQLSDYITKGVPADKVLVDLRDDIVRVGRAADDHLVEVSNLTAAIEKQLTELFDPDNPKEFDRNNAILLAQAARDVGFRMQRWVGRIQNAVETGIYPLIEAEEMYLAFSKEDGRPIED